MGYQSIFYDISNQLQHCLWLLPPMSDGCRQPDLGGAGVLTGRRMSCTSNSRAYVLQNQAVHWEDVACKEESLEFWGWNEAVPKADLGVRLECRQSLKYQWCQGWALWTWQTSLYSPVSLKMRVPVGIILSLTLGHVEELESLGRKEMFSWSSLLAVHSHLPSALQGYKPGLAANPLLLFPFYSPLQPLSLVFHCWVFFRRRNH